MDNIKEIKSVHTVNTQPQTGNIFAFIVTIENPSFKNKVQYFAVSKFVPAPNYVEIYGTELDGKKQADDLKTSSDTIKIIIDKINLYIPWSRIISVRVVK